MKLEILHFYVDQSGPEAYMKEMLKKFSDRRPEVLVRHIDSEVENQLVAQYEIDYIPTLIILKDDQEYGRLLETVTVNDLDQIINNVNNINFDLS